jgi:hypothetical protein
MRTGRPVEPAHHCAEADRDMGRGRMSGICDQPPPLLHVDGFGRSTRWRIAYLYASIIGESYTLYPDCQLQICKVVIIT